MENLWKTLQKFDVGQQVMGRTRQGRFLCGSVCDVGMRDVVIKKGDRHKIVPIASIRFVKQLSLLEDLSDAV